MSRALLMLARAFALLSALAQPALADPQSKSFSAWRIAGDQVSSTFTIGRRELTRLTPIRDAELLPQLWREHLRERVQVARGTPCPLTRIEALPSAPGYARTRMEWHCPERLDSLHITANLMFDQVASHMHFANFRLSDNSRREHLFSQYQRQHQLTAAADNAQAGVASGPVLSTYIRFGFEHILIGLDHIAFLLTLLLLPASWRQRLWIVTGFTLGHSVTLSLSTLGLIAPDIQFTEALIGLSIALVAIENVTMHSEGRRATANTIGVALLALAVLNVAGGSALPLLAMPGLALFCWCYLRLSDSPGRARRLRPWVTSLFGLIHGFGFASVLMEVGVPANSRPFALLGFNLGVELGQIIIVLVCLMLGAAGGRLFRHSGAMANDLLSSFACALGVYWFLQRLYF